MRNLLVGIEGVLRSEQQGKTYVERTLLMEGLHAITGLTSNHRLTLVSGDRDLDRTRWWLGTNGITGYDDLMGPLDGRLDPLVDLPTTSAAKRLRASGADVSLVVTAWPGEAARLLHEGFTSLLWLHPVFARPEHRPEGWRELRPWSELEAEVDAQNLLATKAAIVTEYAPEET